MGNQVLYQSLQSQIKPKACCTSPSLFMTNSNIDPCDITCSICFEIYRSPRIMKCKHTLCTKCISEWGKKPTSTCPYCRTVLRSFRGNFGKVDKIKEKKIKSIVLKCQGCSWRGSVEEYLENFETYPALDDNVMPCERLQEQQIQKQTPEQVKSSQKIKKGDGCIDPLIPQSNSLREEKQKQPTEQTLNYLVAPNQLNLNNPFGEDLFLREYEDSPISRYFSIDRMANWRDRGWDDGFSLEGNDDSSIFRQRTQSRRIEPLSERVETRWVAQRSNL